MTQQPAGTEYEEAHPKHSSNLQSLSQSFNELFWDVVSLILADPPQTLSIVQNIDKIPKNCRKFKKNFCIYLGTGIMFKTGTGIIKPEDADANGNLPLSSLFLRSSDEVSVLAGFFGTSLL